MIYSTCSRVSLVMLFAGNRITWFNCLSRAWCHRVLSPRSGRFRHNGISLVDYLSRYRVSVHPNLRSQHPQMRHSRHLRMPHSSKHGSTESITRFRRDKGDQDLRRRKLHLFGLVDRTECGGQVTIVVDAISKRATQTNWSPGFNVVSFGSGLVDFVLLGPGSGMAGESTFKRLCSCFISFALRAKCAALTSTST